MRRFFAFLWKALFGVVLCLTPVTAVLVVGWLTRLMQRSSFKLWYRESGSELGVGSFQEFVLSNDNTAHLAHWPNWIAGEVPIGEGKVERLFSRISGSLWANLKLGLQMLLNTWVLTLPACLIWMMSWWGGWENSFNKGYEQAAAAPLAGVAGVMLFIIAMLYVPLAQARQAATGNWRAFYDLRLLRKLIRHSRLRAIWLAVSFAVAGLVVAGLRVGPLALGNLLEGDNDITPQKIEQIAAAYQVIAAALIFVMIIALRTIAARIYASGLSRGVRAGDISADMLAENERAFFARLGLLDIENKPAGGLMKRTAVSSGRGLIAILSLVIMLALWLAFVAQLFVSQFLNYNWIGWLNLPLVQIPWFYGP